MKRLVKETTEELKIDVDITFAPDEDNIAYDNLVATTVRPVADMNNRIIDDQSFADYTCFVESVFEILMYYDFEIFEKYQRHSQSFPYTSRYVWIAPRIQVESGDVPKLIHLRVSDHTQDFSEEMQKKIKQRMKDEAQDLKLPKSKLRQRYIPKEIVVNESRFKTYEDALNKIESAIRDWLVKLGVDISDYEFLEW